jgi:hypothetical protein
MWLLLATGAAWVGHLVEENKYAGDGENDVDNGLSVFL